MAGRPKEIFNPGELSRTRKNLGDLSPEEAKRMAEILGGEVGIERTDDVIQKRYKQLADQNRRKHDSALNYHPSRDRLIKKTEHQVHEVRTKEIKDVRQPYIEKIKISVRAFKSEFRIKTLSNLISSFFSFLPGYKNRINPVFIRTINSSVYNHIETLVTSSRILYAGIENKDSAERQNPYYWGIIKTLIEWDIEGMENEIKRLKTFAKSVTAESCANLIRKIYTPIILLSKVHYEKDIKGALEFLYTSGTEKLSPKNIKMPKLRKRYTMAAGSVFTVFSRIKYGIYPLLLMMTSPKSYSYNEMLKYQGKTILEFLDIDVKDIIKFREPKDTRAPDRNADDTAETEDNGESAEEEEESPLDAGISQGLFFLEMLFPEAGWLKLKNNPDMFPYFQPILDLNSDIALIAPEDILQKVIILTGILKELFFGFRSIEYGYIPDEKGNTLDIKNQMDEITDNWYHFLTTLVEKNYLTSLTEYSRQLERDSTFPESDYGKRIEADILWIRKKYIFPHTYLDTPKIMKPRISIAIPKLYEKTEILKTILERMVLEIWNSGEMTVESIRNPEEESKFEVESGISKRIKNYYRNKGKPLLNKYLILSALHVTLVLDYLLNDKRSPAYTSSPENLFRSEGNLGIIPVYSIKADSVSEDRELKNLAEINPDQETDAIDLLSGFPGSLTIKGYIKKHIMKKTEDGTPFTIIKLETRDYTLGKDKKEILSKLIQIIESSIRQFADIPLRISGDIFYIILPETTVEESLVLIKRLMDKTGEELPCFIAAVEYKEPWTTAELLKIAGETLNVSKTFPAPMLTYIDPETGKLEHSL